MFGKKILFIYGPTASGKTALAEKIAALIPAEIINMDSAQMYTPLSIGTAKPDWKKTAFKQHLFDSVDDPTYTTVHTFRDTVAALIQEIHTRGNLAICVGGSGFYLKSLLFKLSHNLASDNFFQKISYQNETPEKLWEKLKAIDPERASQIHPCDKYRLQRALDIWLTTGKKPSNYKPIYAPIAPGILIHVTREREELYQRINQRVLDMIDMGWLEEVKSLSGSDWEPFLTKKGIIGYADLFSYLEKKVSLQDAIQIIQKKTRNYAKRQETFWRLIIKDLTQAQGNFKEETNIELRELNLTYANIDLYIKQLLHDILNKTPVAT